ncbi:hypothetical protein AAF712_006418 [Marasmius tenuissimus]|uniref:F-box domain-containing protein n=1 Tax=Marasmius tenuissimus TaxID=585030 RepID=A0ABR2ZZX6_9AGAR
MRLSSPYDALLDTNFPPPPQDLESIRTLLANSRKRLKQLEDEIALLQAESDELSVFVDRHKALVHPIRRLPPDLLSEIFFHCLPTGRLPVRSITEAPLLLTIICRGWRDVALGHPRLWNSILIQLPEHPGANWLTRQDVEPMRHEDWVTIVDRRSDGIETWLGRSGSLPITFSLNDDEGENFRAIGGLWNSSYVETTFQAVNRLLNVLLQHSSRWMNVQFCVQNRVLQLLDNLDHQELPILRSLRIFRSVFEAVNTPAVVGHQHLSINLFRLPSLREFSVHNDLRNPLEFPISWRTLTTLVITHRNFNSGGSRFSMTPGYAMELLSRCFQTLEVCKLFIVVLPDREDDAARLQNVQRPLVFSRLHTLMLEFELSFLPAAEHPLATDGLAQVFDIIETPSLEAFALRMQTPTSDRLRSELVYEWPPFLKLFRPSRGGSNTITSLDLTTVPIKETSLRNCVASVSSLFVLKLDLDRVSLKDSVLLGALVPAKPSKRGADANRTLCPMLTTLEFRECHPKLSEALCELGCARGSVGEASGEGITRLQKYCVEFSWGLSEPRQMTKRLDLLRRNGMDVQWWSYYRGSFRDDPWARTYKYGSPKHSKISY